MSTMSGSRTRSLGIFEGLSIHIEFNHRQRDRELMAQIRIHGGTPNLQSSSANYILVGHYESKQRRFPVLPPSSLPTSRRDWRTGDYLSVYGVIEDQNGTVIQKAISKPVVLAKDWFKACTDAGRLVETKEFEARGVRYIPHIAAKNNSPSTSTSLSSLAKPHSVTEKGNAADSLHNLPPTPVSSISGSPPRRILKTPVPPAVSRQKPLVDEDLDFTLEPAPATNRPTPPILASSISGISHPGHRILSKPSLVNDQRSKSTEFSPSQPAGVLGGEKATAAVGPNTSVPASLCTHVPGIEEDTIEPEVKVEREMSPVCRRSATVRHTLPRLSDPSRNSSPRLAQPVSDVHALSESKNVANHRAPLASKTTSFISQLPSLKRKLDVDDDPRDARRTPINTVVQNRPVPSRSMSQTHSNRDENSYAAAMTYPLPINSMHRNSNPSISPSTNDQPFFVHFGTPHTFHVLFGGTHGKRTEVLITVSKDSDGSKARMSLIKQGMGGGILVPLHEATYIVLDLEPGIVPVTSAPTVYDQINNRPFRKAVSYKWIDECMSTGIMVDPRPYDIVFDLTPRPSRVSESPSLRPAFDEASTFIEVIDLSDENDDLADFDDLIVQPLATRPVEIGGNAEPADVDVEGYSQKGPVETNNESEDELDPDSDEEVLRLSTTDTRARRSRRRDVISEEDRKQYRFLLQKLQDWVKTKKGRGGGIAEFCKRVDQENPYKLLHYTIYRRYQGQYLKAIPNLPHRQPKQS